MFNIDARPIFKRTVKVQVPTDAGIEEQTFTATFAALDTDELAAFDLSTGDGTTAFLRTVIVALDDIAGKDGALIPYSDELLVRVLKKQWVRIGLYRSYALGISGEAEGN